MQNLNDLATAATKARLNAYAPYSGYRVGAALRDDRGRIIAGCNVENISYGGTICAERNAVAAMIADGGRRVVEIVVVTKDGGTPCGLCLQILSEFVAPEAEMQVHLYAEDTLVRTFRLSELMPYGFKSDKVNRT